MGAWRIVAGRGSCMRRAAKSRAILHSRTTTLCSHRRSSSPNVAARRRKACNRRPAPVHPPATTVDGARGSGSHGQYHFPSNSRWRRCGRRCGCTGSIPLFLLTYRLLPTPFQLPPSWFQPLPRCGLLHTICAGSPVEAPSTKTLSTSEATRASSRYRQKTRHSSAGAPAATSAYPVRTPGAGPLYLFKSKKHN
jgi:hypothetical protein